jgi:ApaG protein
VAPKFKQLRGLKVVVESVEYDPTLPAPKDKPYPFAYYISIHNDSRHTVSFFGRKWILEEELGPTLVVEGDGIVGQFPKLEPGEVFSYNSYHTISQGCVASGAFFGTAEDGTPVAVKVPSFHMTPPEDHLTLEDIPF